MDARRCDIYAQVSGLPFDVGGARLHDPTGDGRRFRTRDDVIRSFGLHRYGFTDADTWR
jgi:hypothetical protein